jgi:hypothetical protein
MLGPTRIDIGRQLVGRIFEVLMEVKYGLDNLMGRDVVDILGV